MQLIWLSGLGYIRSDVHQARLCTKPLGQSDELLVPSLPHAPLPGVSTVLHGCFKNLLSHVKNKCIGYLCTFKSLPKAKCLPYVLPTALVFASVNWGGLGCCCMQVDSMWTWVDKCREHALDQPPHVFEKSGSSEWGLKPLARPVYTCYIMPCAAFGTKASLIKAWKISCPRNRLRPSCSLETRFRRLTLSDDSGENGKLHLRRPQNE